MVDEVILNIVYHPKNNVEVILILNFVPKKKKKITQKKIYIFLYHCFEFMIIFNHGFKCMHNT